MAGTRGGGAADRAARKRPPRAGARRPVGNASEGRLAADQPVEPYFTAGQLLFGAMARSSKTRDLLRDARCVLHSTVTGPDTGEPELKLYGRAIEADDELRNACARGWWREHPREAATVFALDVEAALLIAWDLEEGEMTVSRWSPRHGLSETSRSYP